MRVFAGIGWVVSAGVSGHWMGCEWLCVRERSHGVVEEEELLMLNRERKVHMIRAGHR